MELMAVGSLSSNCFPAKIRRCLSCSTSYRALFTSTWTSPTSLDLANKESDPVGFLPCPGSWPEKETQPKLSIRYHLPAPPKGCFVLVGFVYPQTSNHTLLVVLVGIISPATMPLDRPHIRPSHCQSCRRPCREEVTIDTQSHSTTPGASHEKHL